MRDEMMIVTVCKTFIIRQFMIYSLLFLNRYSGLKLDTLYRKSVRRGKYRGEMATFYGRYRAVAS